MWTMHNRTRVEEIPPEPHRENRSIYLPQQKYTVSAPSDCARLITIVFSYAVDLNEIASWIEISGAGRTFLFFRNGISYFTSISRHISCDSLSISSVITAFPRDHGSRRLL
ncbi:MAG: hypothetical protein LBB61_00605 [Treponema sp.]|nr:hypothetical protein [Treponema sp.]